MRNAYAYVQPSAIEGLSAVILEASFRGSPIIRGDIPRNTFGLAEHGLYFRTGDVGDLTAKLPWALDEPERLASLARVASERVATHFSWGSVADQHLALFMGM
ncbi:MAG: glycosyltransferase [Pseudomonadota bacterium]|nr:glycosyltransferase [Pseudomonadota bacterium]